MIEGSIILHRAWRSQWRRLLVFILLALASIGLSSIYPWSVINGKLFSVGNDTYFLNLPLFSLLPLFGLFNLILPIYDARFTINNRGIETRIGILSLRQTIIKVRYEDIRAIELHQSIIERGLNVGTVTIGSAATSATEISFDGLSSPQSVQTLIQQERDMRMRKASKAEEKIQAAV